MRIESPRHSDAEALGRMQLESWLETYPNEDAGIDESWIRTHRGSLGTAEGTARWAEVIEQAATWPDRVFCRVVRTEGEIVGFLYGSRAEVVTLGPMYLLARAQGQGIGDSLMREFVAWGGATPMRLWVTAYNERAVRFYGRHGFVTTGERELWKGRLPNLRMARP